MTQTTFTSLAFDRKKMQTRRETFLSCRRQWFYWPWIKPTSSSGIHVKVIPSGSRQYVQLVESIRDGAGKVKTLTIATLGRLDQIDDDLDAVIQGLMKVSGQVPASLNPAEITFESARAVGDLWALAELWKVLGFNTLQKIFRKTRHSHRSLPSG